MLTIQDLSVVGPAAILVLLFLWKRRVNSVNVPPGPEPEFLFGHSRKLPSSKSWEVFADWKRAFGKSACTYTHNPLTGIFVGDVIYTHAFGRSTVILNSFAAARDLLEKKNAIFSDRPSLPFLVL